MKVQEIMTREVVTVDPDADLHDVARILVEKRISGAPVCDARGELVGIVSEGDILVKEGGPRDESGFCGLFRGGDEKRAQKVRALKARDAMTAQVLTISPYASVASAARRMSDLGINRLPVVRDGRLLGIVSRTDLMRAFVRSDDEVRREIQEDVLLRTLWLEVPQAVDVRVERGCVRLRGQVESEADAVVLQKLVAQVPGVVSVDAELSWRSADAEGARRERRQPTAPR